MDVNSNLSHKKYETDFEVTLQCTVKLAYLLL